MTARLKYAPFAADYGRKAAAAVNRRGEALLEPIKPQRNTGKNKSHRNKERSEVKGQGRKAKESAIPYVTSHNVRTIDDNKCFRQEKGKGETYGWYTHKIEDQAKQLEKSDITSEHQQPTAAENSCYLSDGTQSSQKRKRLILRIKLKKPGEPDASLAPSTSGRTETVIAPNQPSAETVVNQPSAETNIEFGGLSKCDQEVSCPIPEGSKMLGEKMIGSTTTSDDHISLIENWIPPPLQFASYDDADDDWLFQTKQQDGCGSKRYKADNGLSCSTSSAGWPHAQFLPEAGVYALPFTVPF